MSRAQFWTLNFAGMVCALLMVTVVLLGMLNSTLNHSVSVMQSQFNQAQQIQNTAQTLAVRIAQAGQREAVLRDLLVRHDFKVTLNPEPQKPIP